MKMYLISDNVDTYTGMRLAGVDGIVVHEREELYDALQNVLQDKTVGCPCSWRYRTGTGPAGARILSLPISRKPSD